MLTKQEALTLRHRQELVHNTLKDSRGAAVRCRVNGACVTWKSRPEEFRLPVKYGLYKGFYITQHNAAEWSLA